VPAIEQGVALYPGKQYGSENPNRVVIIETFDTREYAEQIFTSETTHKAMTADGVDLGSLTVEYLDEAA
jgi:hypothetical protein